MAAYRRVYDSRHLQADCKLAKNRHQLRNPTLGIRVRATFTFLRCSKLADARLCISCYLSEMLTSETRDLLAAEQLHAEQREDQNEEEEQKQQRYDGAHAVEQRYH